MKVEIPILSLLIVLAAVLGLLSVSYWKYFQRKRLGVTSPTKSFFLMDQDASVALVTVSYCATLLSAFTFVGLPGFFYSHGIGTWLFIPFSNVAAVLIFYFFGRIFRRLQAEFGTYSPLEVIGLAYGSKSLTLAAFGISVVFIIPHLAVQLAGFGKLATSLGLDYQIMTFLLLIVFVVYTVSAGMLGDVYTDSLQAVLMLVGLWIISVKLLNTWNFDLTLLFSAVKSEGGGALLSLPGPHKFYSHTSLISFVVMFMSVTVVQAPYAMRILIARGERELRGATFHIPWLLLLFHLPTLIIGLGGAALYPGLSSGDHVIGRVLVGLFGSGALLSAIFLGIIVSAMVFAVISTIDSQLLALGAIFTRDVYKARINKQASEQSEVTVGRVAMIGVALLAFVVALNPPRLIIQLSILSVAGTVQMLPMFLGALLGDNKPSAGSAWVSVICGLAVFVLFQWVISTRVVGGMHPGILGLISGTISLLVSEKIIRVSRIKLTT